MCRCNRELARLALSPRRRSSFVSLVREFSNFLYVVHARISSSRNFRCSSHDIPRSSGTLRPTDYLSTSKKITVPRGWGSYHYISLHRLRTGELLRKRNNELIVADGWPNGLYQTLNSTRELLTVQKDAA